MYAFGSSGFITSENFSMVKMVWTFTNEYIGCCWGIQKKIARCLLM